ncbi:unnamed protein product [Mytilus edulis]|uniref:DZIP3-like HEPN domain-containing protein n=1 Tax=Mytilus edulis TaxID=6550 RepID=A0A8S3QFN8_MYTED|nr:unnamed protein product [Mytilus edulis]
MSATSAERQAVLGSFVLRLFPQVMQCIIKEYITSRGLTEKYKQKDIRAALTASEIALMDKLPDMVDFTIELCYKILRYEHLLPEPKCKWGNVPSDEDVGIADDIQRILNRTNEIIRMMFDDISEDYYKEVCATTHDVLKRVDKFLNTNNCAELYHTICQSKLNHTDIVSKLRGVKQVNVTHNIHEVDEKKERYSRISLVVIESFPNMLRNVIQLVKPAREMYNMCTPIMDNFTSDQQTKLQELQSSNSYDSLDISLIYRLLKQFSLINSPTNNWGGVPGKMIQNEIRKKPIKFFWGDSFQRSLVNLRSLLQHEKLEGREKIRIQIIFENQSDGEKNTNTLNAIKDQINEGLSGIEFISATQGMEKISELITLSTTERIDIILSHTEEFTTWTTTIESANTIHLDFNIEARLLKTDDQLREQLSKISETISKHGNGMTTHSDISAKLLPINLGSPQPGQPTAAPGATGYSSYSSYGEPQAPEADHYGQPQPVSQPPHDSAPENKVTNEVSSTHAQVAVFSATLRKHINIKSKENKSQDFKDCIKIGNLLLFTEQDKHQLIIYNADGTLERTFHLDYKPWYLTEINRNTVAVSCPSAKTVLIINIDTGSVNDKIRTKDFCFGISYNDYLYVMVDLVTKKSLLCVMDLAGKVIRTLELHVVHSCHITVHKDMLICIDKNELIRCFL